MASNNVVTVTLRIQDQVSSGMGGIRDAVRSGFDLAPGIAFGNLLSGGIMSAINAATSALAGLGGAAVNAFSQANQIIDSSAGTIAGLMASSSLSFAQSTSFIEELNSALAQAAAALPGETAGYQQLASSISDDLASAFTDLQDATERLDFQKALTDLSSFAGVWQSLDPTKISLGDTSMFLSGVLSGRSLTELKGMNFLTYQPSVRAALERELEKTGKELRDLSVKERYNLLRSALEIPPEVLNQARTSVSGVWAGFMSSLFDPTSGAFGFLRDLQTDVEGRQSLYDQIGRTISAIFGSDGILADFARLTGLANVDVLQGAYNALEGLNRYLEELDKLFGDSDTSQDETRRNYFQQLRELFNFDVDTSAMAEGFADFINNGLRFLASGDFTGIAGQAGTAFGNLFADVVNLVTQTTLAIDWGLFGRGIFNVMVAGLSFIAQGLWAYITGLDYGSLLTASISAVYEYVTGFWSAVGEAAVQLGGSIDSWLIGLEETIDSWIAVARQAGFSVQDGIWSMAQAIVDWAAGIARSLPGGGFIAGGLSNLSGGIAGQRQSNAQNFQQQEQDISQQQNTARWDAFGRSQGWTESKASPESLGSKALNLAAANSTVNTTDASRSMTINVASVVTDIKDPEGFASWMWQWGSQQMEDYEQSKLGYA